MRLILPGRFYYWPRAVLFLAVGIGVFSMSMLGLDTAMINRVAERSSHPRSVVASTYEWKGVTGGKTSPRRTYIGTGLMFANEDNSGIERVPNPGHGPGRIATCFVDHVGWLGGHWISDVHDCDEPVEQAR